MNAADVMTAEVITVSPEASVKDVAQILVQNKISAAPVVDASGMLVGILSEGDLLRRHEIGTDRRRSSWLEIFAGPDGSADYIKSHARKVADVMTRNVVTAKEDATLGEIASLLERHGIKRVPIVRDHRVVGIVSRANLVRAFASLPVDIPARPESDQALQKRVLENIRARPGGMPWLLNVSVRDGVVDLWGHVMSKQEKQAVRIAAESTPGVTAVNDHLFVLPYMAE